MTLVMCMLYKDINKLNLFLAISFYPLENTRRLCGDIGQKWVSSNHPLISFRKQSLKRIANTGLM